MTESETIGENKQFNKIIQDFVNDLCITFPELEERLSIINFEEYYKHCLTFYPEHFFELLYENNELFDKPCYLLPNIDFSKLMNDSSLSENSKKTIWKYIQLILFCILENVDNKEGFGKTEKLFEAISEDDLHEKLKTTMDDMKEMFLGKNGEDISGMMNDFMNMMDSSMNPFDTSGVDTSGQDVSGGEQFNDFMDAEKMKSHLDGLMGGKIGNLAKEIAEEATKTLEHDVGDGNQEEMLKTLFKNPGKILNLVKNIGGKIEEKMKSGDVKESELLEEATEIMDKMKDMPGLKEMMSKMGLNGMGDGKFDFKGMANKMQQQMKQSKMKERMNKKREENMKKREEEQKFKSTIQETNETDTFVFNIENEDKPKKSSKKKASNGAKKKKKKRKN